MNFGTPNKWPLHSPKLIYHLKISWLDHEFCPFGFRPIFRVEILVVGRRQHSHTMMVLPSRPVYFIKFRASCVNLSRSPSKRDMPNKYPTRYKVYRVDYSGAPIPRVPAFSINESNLVIWCQRSEPDPNLLFQWSPNLRLPHAPFHGVRSGVHQGSCSN